MMNPLIEPTNNKIIADALRDSDLPVNVDAEALSKQLAIRRRKQRTRRAAMIAALPMLIVVVGWSVLIVTPDAPNGSPSLVGHVIPVDEDDATEVPGSVGDSLYQRLVERMEEHAQLAEKKAKLRQIQQETESLRKIKSRQQWTLSRELVSRTGLKPALGAAMPY